jgi:hypothetical protein
MWKAKKVQFIVNPKNRDPMGYPIKHKNPCNANASQGFSI